MTHAADRSKIQSDGSKSGQENERGQRASMSNILEQVNPTYFSLEEAIRVPHSQGLAPHAAEMQQGPGARVAEDEEVCSETLRVRIPDSIVSV